jgi:BirA family transcriptional regulator, biotin operon repressor / biotin---[acetyl-CoA-carboxylase] ligase
MKELVVERAAKIIEAWEEEGIEHYVSQCGPFVRIHFPCIDSTQSRGEQLSHMIENECILFTADEQTGGRGRNAGSKWVSPPGGNLYCTFAFPFPKRGIHKLPSISHVVALSVALVLEERGVAAQIKWPNDLLVAGKKICGILCHSYEGPSSSEHRLFLVGIGINVSMSEEDCSKVGQPATSLLLETKSEWDRDSLVKALSYNLSKNIAVLKVEKTGLFWEEVIKRLAFVGKELCVQVPSGDIISGVFEGITREGFMKILLSTGERKTLPSGHIVQ